MKNNFTPKEPKSFNVKNIMALTLFFYLQMLFTFQAQAQNPVVTNSATYDVFMNLDPSRGLNPTNFATDVSTYLKTLGATDGSYRITTSAVTLDPTDVAKWEVYDHYDVAWYANQAAWSASPGGFNNGNIPSNWYYYGVDDMYGDRVKRTISQLLASKGTAASTWGTCSYLQSHIYPFVENGKPAMQFYGYSWMAAADFLYYPADAASTKTVKFDVDAQLIDTHTLISAGYLINGGTTGTGSSKTISGYLLLISASLNSVTLYRLNGVNVDALHNNGTGATGTVVATYSAAIPSKSHIELSITSTSVTATIQALDASGNLTGSKSTMFNSQALINTGFGGFGPFVLYSGHGCSSASAFRFSNIEMAFGGVLSGNSSLEAYQYADYLYNSTKRFFVNLTNTSQTNYSATSNDLDNAYLTNMKDDKVVFITDESTGTYLPGTLNQNIKNVSSEPSDATVAAALGLPNLTSLTSAQQLAAKTAYLIYNTPLGSYGTIPIPSSTAVASLYLMDGPGTDASWTGANQVNEIKSWLVSGESINIYLKPDGSVNAGGLTATYTLKNPSGTSTVITPSTDGNGKLYYAFPKSSATGVWSVTLNYSTGGSITTTVPATTVFNYAPVPQLDGSPVISGTIKYGQVLTVTPNITSVPGITGTLSYQWKANGASITGATNSTYTLTANEVGKTITCDITSNAQPGTKTATASGTVSKITLSSATVTAVTSKTYNGSTATTGGTITFSGTVNSENPTYNATIVWTSANAGTSTVNVSGISLTSLTDRYDLSVTSLSNVTPVNNATISKATLTVTGSAVTSKTYDGSTTAAITGSTLSGKIGSDDVSLGNSTTGTFNNANVGTGKTVTTAMTISGTAAGNYNLTQPTLTGNITAKSVSITGVTAASKVYDGTTTATLSGGTVNTGVGTETLSITAGTGTFADKNVGTRAVTASGFAIADGTNGGLASNYILSAQPTVANQSITAKSVTITGVTAASKVYNGNSTATLSGGTVSTGVGTETLTITAGTGAFADKNVGTKAVTASGYALANGTNGGVASNYSLSAQPVVPDQSITAKSVTITGVSASSKVYDGTTNATLSGGTVSTGVGTETLTITAGTGAFADKNVGTKAVTASGYALANGTNGGLASNYILSAQPTVANQSITAKSVTITGVTAASKVYDGTTDATLSGGSVETGVGSETLSITAGSGTFADKNVGTRAVTASGFSIADGTNGGLASNYTLSAQPVISNQSITAKQIEVTAEAKTKVYGEADPALTYTFTPALISGDSFTGSLSRTAGEDVGSYSINQNDLALSSNYTLNYTSDDLSVTAKPVTVTAEAKTKVYGETDPALTYTFTPALISGDSFTGSLSRTAGEDVGSYSINQNDLALSSNYTLNYTSDDLSVTAKPIAVTAEAKTKVYGDADPALTYTFTPALVSGDSFTGSLSRTAGEDVGSYSINQNDLALSSNYTLSYTSDDLSVTAKPISVTAEAKTKVYGDADPALTYTFTPALISGDSFTGSLSRTAGEDVGSYSINQNDLALSSNYTLSYTSDDLSVTAKPVAVTAEAKTKVYGEADPALTYTFTPALISGDSFTGSLSRTAGEDVGSYSIIRNDLALSSNYTLSYASADLTVNKATLTVTAESREKVYGSANPVLTFSYSGFVAGEDESVLDTKPTAATSITISSDAGLHAGAITVAGGADNNYQFSYVPAGFNITKAVLSAVADNKTKVYGEANPELTFTYSGFVNGDDRNDIDVPPSIVTEAGTESHAGVYPVILALGSDNNYVINRTDGSLTITKAALTATADNKSKKYSEVNPGLTVSYTGFVNGDVASSLDVAPVPSTAATVSSGAGSYPVTLSAGSDNNYEITNVDGTLIVSKAVLKVTADNKSKIYGQPNPELTLSYSGFVNGDNLSAIDSKPSAFTVAGLASDAGSYEITADGGSDNNYSFEYRNGSLEIAKADQTITFQPVTSGLRATQHEELEATATSGLPVSFESSSSDIAEVDGNTLAVLKEGTVTITAHQDGNHNYNPATVVAQTIETLPTFDNLRSLFTPNNDGMNDYWYIPDIEQYGNIHVQIYNRYGKLLYESSAYKNDWDGTYNGRPLPEASYYYIIKSEKLGMIKGVVNIVR